MSDKEGFRLISKGEYDHTLDNKMIQLQREEVNKIYETVSPLSPMPLFMRQTNPGMLTCAFASAINALRFVDVHRAFSLTEQDFINVLGGEKYVERNTQGATLAATYNAIMHLSPPEVFATNTSSIPEMLKHIENGMSAIFLTDDHFVAIAPGQRVDKDAEGQLQVEVADPYYNRRFVSMEKFLQHIPISNPRLYTHLLLLDNPYRRTENPVNTSRFSRISTSFGRADHGFRRIK